MGDVFKLIPQMLQPPPAAARTLQLLCQHHCIRTPDHNPHPVPPPRLSRLVALDEVAFKPIEGLPFKLLAYPLVEFNLQPEVLGGCGEPTSGTPPELLKGGVAGCPVSRFRGVVPVGVSAGPPKPFPEPPLLSTLGLAFGSLTIRVCLAAA